VDAGARFHAFLAKTMVAEQTAYAVKSEGMLSETDYPPIEL
jgi:hypothetical protein